MLKGIDRAAGITPGEWRQVEDALGPVDFCLVYVGGPRNGGHWTPADVARLAQAQPNLRFLPVWVGRNAPWDTAPEQYSEASGRMHGELALMEAQTYDLIAGSGGLCLDVEHETWNTLGPACLPYIRGWCAQVRAGGMMPIVYSGLGLTAQLQREGLECLTYAAYWPWTGPNWLKLQGGQWPMLNLTLGGLSRVPEAWQFCGNVPLIGAIDVNVARDDFPVQPWQNEAEEPVSEEAPTVEPDAALVALTRTVDSLSGSVSELYARIGELEKWREGVEATPAPSPLPTYTSADAAPDAVDGRDDPPVLPVWRGADVAGSNPDFDRGRGQTLTFIDGTPTEYVVAKTVCSQPGENLVDLAAHNGHSGEVEALAAANPELHPTEPLPFGTIVTLPAGW